MPRALLTTSIVAADAGGLIVVENALVRVYERGTTTPASGVYADEVGGSAITSVLSDVHGVVTLWFDTARIVDLNVTDNSHTATKVGTSTPAVFGAYTLPAIPDSGGGGGGGAVASVEGRTGVVDLSDLYLSPFNGVPQPTVPDTVGAATFTPDLTDGNRFKVITTGNPTIAMPAVAAGTTYRSFELILKMDGTGGYGDPTWDAKITWVGIKSTRQQGAGKWDQYLFTTDDGGTTWSGWHITASFAIGANSVDWQGVSTPATPSAGTKRAFMATTGGLLKVVNSAGEVSVCEVYVGSSAPASPAVNQVWVDTT